MYLGVESEPEFVVSPNLKVRVMTLKDGESFDSITPSPDDNKYLYERLILDAPKSLTMPNLKEVAEKQKQQDALFDEWFNSLLNKAKERQNKP